MHASTEYQVYAVRFAHFAARRRTENFIGGDPHDGPMPFDYFVFAVRSAHGTWVVDTGFDAEVARRRNRTVGGRTDGQQVLRVHTRKGWMVLASDAAHFTENLRENRPFPGIYHVGAALDGFETLRRLADHEDLVIPGHDPGIMQRFPPASDAASGIAVRLD